MEKDRFLRRKLKHIPDAGIKHAEITNQRDKLGNRWFLSENLTFKDRAGERVKAGITISPEGENFIKRNRGILNHIEGLLRNPNINSVNSSTDIKIEDLFKGNQSVAKKITIGATDHPEIIVVKFPRMLAHHFHGQPYVNEMLQVQTLANSELKNELEQAGIDLPTFYFSSGVLSCAKFEQGSPPHSEKIEKVMPVLEKVESYIKTNQQNPLWKNIQCDIKDDKTGVLLTRNFIERPDGAIVWIDPFVYKKEKKEKVSYYNRIKNWVNHTV